MEATAEQKTCLAAFNSGQDLRIDAAAGSGKTTTLRYLMARGARQGRTLYTSFGRKIVEEARSRFPVHVDVRTNHSLAYRSCGNQWRAEGRLQNRITGYQLAQACGWGSGVFAPHADTTQGGYAVMQTIANFCGSGDDALATDHVPLLLDAAGKVDRDYTHCVLEQARAVWERMMAPGDRVPITHDVYLKAWALTHPRLEYDAILLDEAQDTSGLMIRLLAEQTHAQRVIVGDRYQQIYAWRGAVNAMRQFKVDVVGKLTRSFRFGPAIATLANSVLEQYAGAKDLHIEGSPELGSTVNMMGRTEPARAVVGRTNAALIVELIETQMRDRRNKYAVVGGVAEMKSLLYGIQDLMRGKRSSNPELLEFVSWQALMRAAADPPYAHLRPLVDLVNGYRIEQLLDELGRAEGNERDEAQCKRVFSTTHRAKGREFESVELLGDFKVRDDKKPGQQGYRKWNPEEGNILYVAVTRAKLRLDAGNSDAIRDVARRAGLRLDDLANAA